MRKAATAVVIGLAIAGTTMPGAANATIMEWATSFERFMAGLKTVDRQVSSSASQTQHVITTSKTDTRMKLVKVRHLALLWMQGRVSQVSIIPKRRC
jgi:hypothetical protein